MTASVPTASPPTEPAVTPEAAPVSHFADALLHPVAVPVYENHTNLRDQPLHSVVPHIRDFAAMGRAVQPSIGTATCKEYIADFEAFCLRVRQHPKRQRLILGMNAAHGHAHSNGECALAKTKEHGGRSVGVRLNTGCPGRLYDGLAHEMGEDELVIDIQASCRTPFERVKDLKGCYPEDTPPDPAACVSHPPNVGANRLSAHASGHGQKAHEYLEPHTRSHRQPFLWAVISGLRGCAAARPSAATDTGQITWVGLEEFVTSAISGYKRYMAHQSNLNIIHMLVYDSLRQMTRPVFTRRRPPIRPLATGLKPPYRIVLTVKGRGAMLMEYTDECNGTDRNCQDLMDTNGTIVLDGFRGLHTFTIHFSNEVLVTYRITIDGLTSRMSQVRQDNSAIESDPDNYCLIDFSSSAGVWVVRHTVVE